MLYLQLLLLLLVSAVCASHTPSPNKESTVENDSNREAAAVTTEASTGKDSDEDSDSSDNEEINWQCGTDAFTRLISESTIDRDCPELKVPINDCCLAHDDCYDKQLGRKNCDDTFCNCLDNVTRSNAICFKEDAPAFCGLVREFGEEPYKASANPTTKEPKSSVISLKTTTAEPRSSRPTPKYLISSTAKPNTTSERPQAYAAKVAMQNASEYPIPLGSLLRLSQR